MTCIKTGCVAYLVQYNEWVYGDAHEYGFQTLAIRAVHAFRDPAELKDYGGVRHFTIHEIDDWWDRPTNRSPRRNADVSTVLSCGPGKWANHGYEGIKDPQVPQEAKASE